MFIFKHPKHPWTFKSKFCGYYVTVDLNNLVLQQSLVDAGEADSAGREGQGKMAPTHISGTGGKTYKQTSRQGR